MSDISGHHDSGPARNDDLSRQGSAQSPSRGVVGYDCCDHPRPAMVQCKFVCLRCENICEDNLNHFVDAMSRPFGLSASIYLEDARYTIWEYLSSTGGLYRDRYNLQLIYDPDTEMIGTETGPWLSVKDFVSHVDYDLVNYGLQRWETKVRFDCVQPLRALVWKVADELRDEEMERQTRASRHSICCESPDVGSGPLHADYFCYNCRFMLVQHRSGTFARHDQIPQLDTPEPVQNADAPPQLAQPDESDQDEPVTHTVCGPRNLRNIMTWCMHHLEPIIATDPKHPTGPECPICGDKYSNDNPEMMPMRFRGIEGCKDHIFCHKCIIKWLSTPLAKGSGVYSIRCPLCRSDLLHSLLGLMLLPVEKMETDED
ncbi:hypothetical protein BU23DRAFT_304490 [Bimuria novae-zelandiae CBS 107.79]|uniref:RING-type domain-containing protein n=1 Tax=Bimuria novae-zelandiae CBS 107.79 TaxID=1447943 RepID=A0A6A5UTR2_9PLEO|nr:hypothetical protein BU23DRAFT_304490 [Bimuria novae-zelandiae CBS 107.79]